MLPVHPIRQHSARETWFARKISKCQLDGNVPPARSWLSPPISTDFTQMLLPPPLSAPSPSRHQQEFVPEGFLKVSGTSAQAEVETVPVREHCQGFSRRGQLWREQPSSFNNQVSSPWRNAPFPELLFGFGKRLWSHWNFLPSQMCLAPGFQVQKEPESWEPVSLEMLPHPASASTLGLLLNAQTQPIPWHAQFYSWKSRLLISGAAAA